MNRKIAIQLHPASSVTKQKFPDREFQSYTYKEESTKKRYMCGVASGMAVDAHGERMSESCVKDMQNQFQNKDILLYVNHGKDYTEDIGILEKSTVLDNGDLYHEYRLYDETDSEKGIPTRNIQEANQVWLQANGLPPYKKPRSFGFSIEGIIPENKITWSPRGNIIEQVDLDPGVSLVTKPAYTTSVAHAIKKALSNIQSISNESKESPQQIEAKPNDVKPDGVRPELKSKLESYIIEQKSKIDHIAETELIEEGFEKAINETLMDSLLSPEEKKSQLFIEFNQFRDRMIELYSQFDYNVPSGFASLSTNGKNSQTTNVSIGTVSNPSATKSDNKKILLSKKLLLYRRQKCQNK